MFNLKRNASTDLVFNMQEIVYKRRNSEITENKFGVWSFCRRALR